MQNIMKALAIFQAKCCVLGKDGRGHGYNYTTFDKILNHTRKPLLEAGLVVVQPIECMDGAQHVRTIVVHAESGERIDSTYALDLVQLKAANNAQQMGAAISYARRYAFLATLGLAAGGEDSDAADIDPHSTQEEQAPAQSFLRDDSEPEGNGYSDSDTADPSSIDSAYRWACKLVKDRGDDGKAELQSICEEFCIPYPPSKTTIASKMTNELAIELAERCRQVCES